MQRFNTVRLIGRDDSTHIQSILVIAIALVSALAHGDFIPYFTCDKGDIRHDLDGTPQSCFGDSSPVVRASYKVFRCMRHPGMNYWQQVGRIPAEPCPKTVPPADDTKVRINCFNQTLWLGYRVSADVFLTTGDVHWIMPGHQPVHVPFAYTTRTPVLTFDRKAANGFCQNMVNAMDFLLRQGRALQAQGQACGIQCLERAMRTLDWLDPACSQALQSHRAQIQEGRNCRSSIPTTPGPAHPKVEQPKHVEPPLPQNIKDMLNTPRCRNCRCHAPDGRKVCLDSSFGWMTKDGKNHVSPTGEPGEKSRPNLCMVLHPREFTGENCSALNNTQCAGYAWGGPDKQPASSARGFPPGWEYIENGTRTCADGPPRPATIDDYKGEKRLEFLTPLASVQKETELLFQKLRELEPLKKEQSELRALPSVECRCRIRCVGDFPAASDTFDVQFTGRQGRCSDLLWRNDDYMRVWWFLGRSNNWVRNFPHYREALGNRFCAERLRHTSSERLEWVYSCQEERPRQPVATPPPSQAHD